MQHMNTNESRISHALRHRRMELGLSQSALAELANVGRSTIVRIESQMLSASLDNQRKISEAIGWPANGFTLAATDQPIPTSEVDLPALESSRGPSLREEVRQIHEKLDQMGRDLNESRDVLETILSKLKAGDPR